MLKKQIETKRGAAAIYVVVFTATLLSIIALSFVRLMITELGRTSNYSLSQSAYNSALAGIEDAKIVLLRYQNCVNNPNYTVNGQNVGCDKLIDYLQTNVDKYSQDCDLVGKALNYNISNHETIIQTESNSEKVNESATAFDQAYTCVKVSPQNKDYITTLTENYPSKIVPLRTDSGESTDSVNRIVLSWFSRKDLSSVNDTSNNLNTNDFRSFKSAPEMNGVLTDNNIFLSNTENYKNTFTEKPVVPSVIRATLIQTAETFKLSQFYSSRSGRTNRGSITLRPSTANPYGVTKEKYSNHIGGDDFSTNGGPFVASATKSQNTPLDVHCFIDDNMDTANGYACTADIYIPKPIGYSQSYPINKRNRTTFFLVLNLPYGGPETEVNVELKHCDRDSDSIYKEKGATDESGCNSVKFANVQPVIDSTGRANDLFRRVEARVELIDNYFPIVNYALAVNDPESNDDNIIKDFYVTKNCTYSESVWNEAAGVVEEKTKGCPNSGR